MGLNLLDPIRPNQSYQWPKPNPIQHMIEKYGPNPTQPNFGQRVSSK